MKKTILIIDDEPAIRQSMSDIFSDEGYIVICAEDGTQALSLLEKETPDLIFLKPPSRRPRWGHLTSSKSHFHWTNW